MPLIILTGYPTSGKTHRAQQLVAGLRSRIASSDVATHSRLSVVCVGDESLAIPRTTYAEARTEKDARAALASAVKRALTRDVIVVVDAPNYIKGFRYQLWCEAKAVGTTSCVVHVGTPIPQCRAFNEALLLASADHPASSTSPAAAAAADGYTSSLHEELIFRYEEPSGMNRWDRPLFTVASDDADAPSDAVWEALVGGGKIVRPHRATVLAPPADVDTLQHVEATTAAVVACLTAFCRDRPGELGGTVAVPGAEEPVRLPAADVSLPQLQRLRRQYLALARTQRVDGTRVAEGFVAYLNGSWE